MPEHFTLPDSHNIAACRKLDDETESALRLPPDQAEAKLRDLQERIKQLHPFFQQATPSFVIIGGTELEAPPELQKLLKTLKGN